MPDASILILDDDPDVAWSARLLLRRRFGEVVELNDPRQLMAQLERQRPAVLLLDLNFSPGRSDGEEGLAMLRRLAGRADAPAVIVLTAYAAVPLAVEAVKLGAFDFITKPWDNAKLVATVGAALARSRPAAEGPSHRLLGRSAAMQELRALIASVAPTAANVLILGESGVGKELVAQALHDASPRAAHPMLVVDMGALPDSMFESELFGHRKGSFTDAGADRAGRFRAADGGTLFLDEIGNMPLAHQARLLTVLERREVTPLGVDKPQAVDVRVISATNLDETCLFDAGRFRADLLYRLNTIVLRVPPLRARRDDVVLLAEHYLAHYGRQYGKLGRSLSNAARTALAAHDWPGNVRALRNACERAVILANEAGSFEPGHFELGAAAAFAPPAETPPLTLSAREREAVSAALKQAQGNISQAAKLLGLSRAALYRKLEKHGL